MSLKCVSRTSFRTCGVWIDWRIALYGLDVGYLRTQRCLSAISINPEPEMVTVHGERCRCVGHLDHNRCNRSLRLETDIVAKVQLELGRKAFQPDCISLCTLFASVGDCADGFTSTVDEFCWVLNNTEESWAIRNHR